MRANSQRGINRRTALASGGAFLMAGRAMAGPVSPPAGAAAPFGSWRSPRSREAELYFYGKVFGFTPADPIEPVVIENL